MNTNVKRTVLAIAIAAASASVAAQDNQNQSANINHMHNVVEARTNLNTNVNTNIDTNYDTNVRNDNDSRTWNRTRNTNTNTNTNTATNTSNNTSNTRNTSSTTSTTIRDDVSSNHNTTVNSNVTRNRNVNVNEHSNIQADERKEKNNHGVDVNLEKVLRLSSDVNFSGDPEITGSLEVNSAAIAVIDNRQSVTNNEGSNHLLENNASISENVAQDASGNLGFNVAAGDNNAQDNAASLSAADASFTFGMSDAEVFVNQYGAGNMTMNEGVVNNSSLSGNAFRDASGNIGVNSAAGNNNEQKNALAASVSTARMAQSSISSNQVSSGNAVSNEGYMRAMSDTTEVTLRGRVAGATVAIGGGAYEGRGNAYQKDNYYLDSWSGDLPHPGGNATGHLDMDSDIQNATANPYNDGVGGIAFDTDEEGRLGFIEVGAADLYASLSGTVRTTRWVNVNAENNASLSGDAFRGATGNIGVNVAAGSGNLQANSLALAVAQPSTGGGGGGGGGEGR